MSGILVAGGGPAGAAAAAELSRGGRRVTLIERHVGPAHKICGEFLSFEAQAYLRRIGLDVERLGGAPISRLRLVRRGGAIETKLPFRGIGLSRFALDEALLRHAGACGVDLLRGRTIRALEGAELEVEGEGRLRPETLLLATGKHELRGAGRRVGAHPDMIGFKMYFRLNHEASLTLQDHIELIFFAGGYAGLQMIEEGIANLCLLVKRESFAESGGSWEALLEFVKGESGYLARQLRDAVPQWRQPLTIYRVPYGFIHRPAATDPARLFRLGDQACVIHSFTGDGMAIALHSAALAVRTIENGGDAASYHDRLARDLRAQIKRANGMSLILNSPLTQSAALGMTRLLPRSLAVAAALTRVPPRARLPASLQP